jgi:K+/H+ antiporter YhaU regulatory subunit KhtT
VKRILWNDLKKEIIYNSTDWTYTLKNIDKRKVTVSFRSIEGSALLNGSEKKIEFLSKKYDVQKSEFKDKSIKNLDLRTHTGVNIIALKKDDKYAVNPDPDIVISKGVSLIVLGDSEQMERFENVAIENPEN